MRKSCLIRSIPTILVLCFASLAITSTAQAAAFAKFDGIDGESKDDKHQGWIDVLSITEAISRPLSGAVGSGRVRGAAVFEDIVLVKQLDRASVTLREKLAQGASIPRLDIELTRTFGGQREAYFKYELTNVQITSFQLGASGDDSLPATETISVNFEKIRWTYILFDDAGREQGKVEAGWDVEAGGKI